MCYVMIMKVARMMILVAVTFLFCWMPFYAVTTVTQLQTDSFLRHSQFLFTMLSTHWAGFCSCAVNPLIYAAMSYQFRRSFKQVRLAMRGRPILVSQKYRGIKCERITVIYTIDGQHTSQQTQVTQFRAYCVCYG